MRALLPFTLAALAPLVAGCSAPFTSGVDGSGGLTGGGGSGGGAAPDFCADPGLLACFRFDGDALDGSPLQNHADASSVSYSPGVENEAISLAASSLVQVPSNPSLGVASFTVEAWIFPADMPAPGGRRGIVDHDGRWGFFLYEDGLRCSGGGAQTSSAPVPAATWSHVACVADGSEVRVYVDGAQIEAVSTGAIDPSPGGEPLHIGSNAPTGNDCFIGSIDGLRLFGTVRTSAEICAAAHQSGC